jgi:DNA invertase Pin-like site-specific DNA recombinase
MKTNTAPVIGYTRVSKENRDGTGVSLDEQAQWLAAEATRRNLDLNLISEGDGVSGKAMRNRPELKSALEALAKGEASALMVKKLDRLTRSVADFLTLLELSQRQGWALIIGDLDIDTSTPMGEAMATICATFAQLERKRIGERTSDALQLKKAQGMTLGRPDRTSLETVQKVQAMRETGASLQTIANSLNAQGVPTAQGGSQWYASSIRKVLARVS